MTKYPWDITPGERGRPIPGNLGMIDFSQLGELLRWSLNNEYIYTLLFIDLAMTLGDKSVAVISSCTAVSLSSLSLSIYTYMLYIIIFYN